MACKRCGYNGAGSPCPVCWPGSAMLRNQTPTVTKPRDENVTVSTTTVRISPEELEKADYTHGGVRDGSGRKRRHKTNAERQKAYRSRK